MTALACVTDAILKRVNEINGGKELTQEAIDSLSLLAHANIKLNAEASKIILKTRRKRTSKQCQSYYWDSTFLTIHRGITCPPLDPPCYLRPTMHMASALKTEFTQGQCYLMYRIYPCISLSRVYVEPQFLRPKTGSFNLQLRIFGKLILYSLEFPLSYYRLSFNAKF